MINEDLWIMVFWSDKMSPGEADCCDRHFSQMDKSIFVAIPALYIRLYIITYWACQSS